LEVDIANIIRIENSQFKDEYGRVLLLRGINLSGSSKIPWSGNTPASPDFYNHRSVSFVNRPFPLEEADEHFSRLHHWGLTFLRLLVPWEAIEHAGPGQYDEAYLDYLYRLAVKANQYGIRFFVDPHQDAWSRFSGGDGAPGWTLEAVGFNLKNLHSSGAAIIYNASSSLKVAGGDNASPSLKVAGGGTLHDRPRRLQWITNYTRLAAATMFTLFFGGNDFAPHLTIEGEPAQEFLQRHYINAFKQVAQKLSDLPNIAGFGTMNEPSAGFIGLADLRLHSAPYLALGPSPTPFQAILLGAGYAQEVDLWEVGWRGHRPRGKIRLNPQEVSAWQEDRACIWREHGVWDLDSSGQPRLLQPDYFSRVDQNMAVDFAQDYLKPFIQRFARSIRCITSPALIFIETTPTTEMPRWGAEDTPHVVNATHWYDVFSLFTALFIPVLTVDQYTRRPVWGLQQVQDLFIRQLGAIKQAGLERMGGAPTLLGEFGVSFNMPFQLNYRFNWFGMQEWALDAIFRALETHLLSGTLWNYTSDNTNPAGDVWNMEDLSIFSRTQQRNPADINSGGRALRAFVRPYPRCTAGEPLFLGFNYRRGHFLFRFRHDPAISEPTEIFVPALSFPQDHPYQVQVSDGRYEKDTANQLLRYWYGAEQEVHTIEINRV
jgi:hypothetical protein